MTTILKTASFFWLGIRSIGSRASMDDYEKRKLSVFNQLNCVGVICGLFIPLAGLFDKEELPLIATVVAFSPAFISSLVLYLNHLQKHETARMVYFSFYPVLTSLVYAAGMNVGVELFFILYGILSVFYMQKRSNGIIAFFLSMACYLSVFVFFNRYEYNLQAANFSFYVLNHCIAIVFIFFSLSWLRAENTGYQQHILHKSEMLYEANLEMAVQKEEIAKKAEQLSELNALKNKLFSVISHDLKTPMYALRNLFRNVEKYDVPGDELKQMVPEIMNDLNYTTALMENLLQWTKSQMQADTVHLEELDVTQMVNDITNLLHLQAKAKNIYISNKLDQPVYVYADKDMLNLVLRNLISNAIKFTPERGNIKVEAWEMDSMIEISVTDTGVGMTPEVLSRLSDNSFYSSKGTANETGTGLGLMLCKEFLKKIGSRMFIESEYGKGSTFSFTLSRQ